jgi:hypothetical protein
MVMSETMMVVPMLTLLSDEDDAFMTNAFLTSEALALVMYRK